MSSPLKCPQCGASEASLLQDNIYQCKFCGSIYEYGDVKQEIDQPILATAFDEKRFQGLPSKILRFIFFGIALSIFGVAAFVIFSIKSNMKSTSVFKSTTTPTKLYADNNETNSSFTVVKTKDGPQVWTVSRKNSDGLKDVSYALNKIDVKENNVSASYPIGKTITWEQSFKEEYRIGQLKQMGNVCWLTYGDKLLGYDANTQEEVINNETLCRQFTQLKNGIAKVEDVYDMDGFKLTTKDGYTYYYAAMGNKLLSEKQYDDKYKAESDLTKTEYCFTEDERQKLYKIIKKTNNLFDTKISSNTLSSILKDDDGWYKKTYKINSAEEFTPNEIYFKAAVLYNDEDKIVIVYQKELGESGPIILKCMDANKKEIWSKTGDDALMFKPFLKSTNSESFMNTNQLVLIQPYQIALNMNMDNGEVLWFFKPY